MHELRSQYRRDGYYFPIDICSTEAADRYADQVRSLANGAYDARCR